MNADQQAVLAAALERALRESGIVIERAAFAKGNIRSYEQVDLAAAARRTIGIWCSWGWVLSLGTPGTSTVVVEQAGYLRLMPQGNTIPIDSYLATDGARQPVERQNNDDEDDGS